MSWGRGSPRQPDWQLQSTVHLTGEVRYPGTYSLTSKKERLSEIIERAGGLSSNAFASGIVFTRADKGVGRVGIDLPSVMRNPANRDNLLMVHGDSVHVPRFNALVMVSGAVSAPIAVPYEPGASVDHYIRAAGGAMRSGDQKRAYVSQANGKVETRRRMLGLFSSAPKPGPGSRVVVPPRDQSDKRDLTQFLGTMAQIAGSIVTVVLVLNRTN
jgi:polysaccharide biosynthesis/export protein